MKKGSRIILLCACLLMIASFKLPLWRIDLQAPQYPEGLMMNIWLDHLSGQVGIINELNHYIGMGIISEEVFPELKFMKYVIMGVIATGLLISIIGNKWLFAGWYFAFLGIAAYGIYDFWHWEYVYGHNLNPDAAIQIPGMTYQPPLIGPKQLLNFYATSWPDWGGIILMSMGTLSALILFYEFYWRRRKNHLA